MLARSLTLLLCALGAAHAAVAPPHARRPRALDDGDRWQNLIAEYSRGASGAWAGGGRSWLPPAIPLQVPLPGDTSGRASMSVLVVPVPVPIPAPEPRASPAQCTLSAPLVDTVPPRTLAPAFSAGYDPGYNVPPYIQNPFNQFILSLYNQVPAFAQHPETSAVPSYNPLPTLQPSTTPAVSLSPASNPAPLLISTLPAPSATPAPSAPPALPVPSAPPRHHAPSQPSAQHDRTANVHYESRKVPPPPLPALATPRPPATDELVTGIESYFPPVEDSRLLVEQFRAQIPVDPSLPPIGTDQPYPEAPVQRRLQCKRRRSKAVERASGELEREARQAPPPPPRFERSLFVRARLTVPRADYTEPYSMWWDAASGATRVDFHGGATSSYRMVKRDGRVQSAQIRVDRSGDAEVRRCVLTAPRRVTVAERALPALPDLQAFSFAGYVVRGVDRAERWQYTLSGHSGELGGARGEALTFRHELLVTRTADNYTTTPYLYSVRVDSSVLGADCDGYIHFFDEVQTRHHDSSMFHLDIADACEQVETMNRMENVEPLREFTMLRRDPRHDAQFEQYKQKFGRIYADDWEEAVRKNMLMQMTRFTESGNRQGTTMQLGTNFISDRVLLEQNFLLGTLPPEDQMGDYAQPLPISNDDVEALRGRLPRNFDWRKIGAITKVRNQMDECASCWAISTVGAVEGQLFRRIRRLVPLSEQALMDCAKPYGGHGCTASKQRSAYNYIIDKGVSAYEDYPFIGKQQQCRAGSVTNVTRISGYYNVTQNNILALKVAIKRYGPTVVIVDSSPISFKHHKSGHYYDTKCFRSRCNHAMLVVGWTEREGETDFIIKNSWGTTWGEKGYVHMRMSKDNIPCGANSVDSCGDPCGLLRRASLPNLRDTDVLSVPRGAQTAARSPAVL